MVAFYGCSRKGIGSQTEGEIGPSQMYEGVFYSILFNNENENKSFGKIAGLSKKAYKERADGTNFFRWLQFGINPIGDPEMPIYVTKPKKFDSFKVRRNGAMYRFDTGIPGCTFSITGKKNGKDFRVVLRKSDFINVNINNLPADAVLVISKQNYIPIIAEGLDQIKALFKEI